MPRSEEELAFIEQQRREQQQRRAHFDEVVMRGVFEWSKIADEMRKIILSKEKS